MNHIKNLSVREMALVISLLDEQAFSFLMQVIDLLSEPHSNNNAIAHLNVHLPDGECAPDIVGWKRSQPLSMAHLIEQAAVFKTLDYHLTKFDSVNRLHCNECGQQTLVSIISQKRNQTTDTHDFELCLSCYQAVRLFPIYTSAEEEV